MNRLKKIILTSLSVISVPLVSSAQLTIDRCFEMAKAHYPAVAQYNLIDESESFDIASAARSWIPQITFSGQASWQTEAIAFPDAFNQILKMQGVDMPGMNKDQYNLVLDISQTLWDGGASKTGKELARAEAAEKRLDAEVSIYALEERVSSLFFGILLLEANYQTAVNGKETLDANYRKLESMVRNGVALQSDLDMLEVERISLDEKIRQNRASASCFRTMLELFIGEPIGGRSLVKPDEIPVGDISSNRPELRLLDAKLTTLDARERMLGVSLTPKIAAFAQGLYGYPGLDMFKSMENSDWRWNAIVGVRLQWNITPFFTYGTDRKKIENARRMLTVQKDVFEFNSSLQAAQQTSEIKRMGESLESDGRIVELRTGIRKTAESQFEKGVIDTPALLQRISEESAAMNSRNIHEIELLKMEYDLRHTLNK
ncbi:MAG: TolC family protein [Bacteroidia bacterium]|nr:TolC family protein [Bacteroidia bacterium]